MKTKKEIYKKIKICNKINLFVIGFITFAEIVLLFSYRFSLSSNTIDEYLIAAFALFALLVLAAVNYLIVNGDAAFENHLLDGPPRCDTDIGEVFMYSNF